MRKQLHRSGMNYIIKTLDIACLVRRVKELECLRDVLLDDDQLALFRFIPKAPPLDDEDNPVPSINDNFKQMGD